MSKNEEHTNKTVNMLERLQSSLECFKGKTVIVKEYVTTNESTYDRHFTSCAYFKLRIANCGMRYSGARFWIEGIDENNGELFVDAKNGDRDYLIA